MKNGQPIDSTASLVLHHPTPNDDANYKCVARNQIGTIVSEPYRVEIHALARNAYHNIVYCEPKITEQREKTLICRYKHSGRIHRKRSASDGGSQPTSKRKKINVAEDNSATINCDASRVDRKGQVSVRWKKDGKLIRQSVLSDHTADTSNANSLENPLFRDDGRLTLDSKTGSITIASTIPSDAGIYEVSMMLEIPTRSKSTIFSSLFSHSVPFCATVTEYKAFKHPNST